MLDLFQLHYNQEAPPENLHIIIMCTELQRSFTDASAGSTVYANMSAIF